MTLGQRLREARKCAGYTQKQLAGMIGAKHNSVSNWENGLNMPDPPTIESICEVLRVTPNYLLMGDELGVASGDGFSMAEAALLKKYRGLDRDSRGAIDTLLDYYHGLASLKAVNLSTRESSRPISGSCDTTDAQGACRFEVLRGVISTQSVAAGTGTYLGPDAFDAISVQENGLTKKAAFYVPVAGDSMEPRFSDGDILIIERAPVGYGEIGIFTLEGQGFVKVRGKSELISLNPNYDPIPMSDDIICNGKVIGVLDPEWLAD